MARAAEPRPAASADARPPRPARLCLKARPTPVQLADRLQPIDGRRADGIELYLDASDLADVAAMDAVVAHVEAADLPPDMALLAEGPVGSLDGAFFDVTRASEADRLVVERLADLTRRLRLRAVNIHVISPDPDVRRLTLAQRTAGLHAAVPFLAHFVDVIGAAGATPTVENMPPVMRMRVGGWYFSPIGLASADLRWLVERVPGLAILPDTSHTGLYLNARRMALAMADDDEPAEPWRAPLFRYLRELPDEPSDLAAFIASFGPHVANAQVSNAAGLLGEGLPYAEGDFDLDPVIRWLGAHAEHLVTETLEPDHDDARFMRDALRRMRLVLA